MVSAIAWGLGYFGQPHILARFMAADDLRTMVLDLRNRLGESAPSVVALTGVASGRMTSAPVRALSGGTPVHYRCDEANGWDPDLADIESKITENTHALVVINPNNPDGGLIPHADLVSFVERVHGHVVEIVFPAPRLIMHPEDVQQSGLAGP